MNKAILKATALAGALALVPATTAALAEAEGNSYRTLDEFMDVFQRVRSDYVDKVDDETLIKGAINGMLSSLDPHSSFLDARDFENLRTQTDGAYGGLGLSVTMEDGAVKVIAPPKGTPADRAGLKAGDSNTHLNGELIFGGTLDDAVERTRGHPATSLPTTLSIATRPTGK